MTITYPALRGKFGNTKYYVVSIRVSELVSMIQFPADLPDWDDRSLEEQFQRKLDMPRINRHIAPYFATDKQRFSGALVVATQDNNSSGLRFESISKIAGSDSLPHAYATTMGDLGFITLENQKFIPLDGQHRAKAFQLVIDDPAYGQSGLGDDKISVIIIAESDDSIYRYIFNKINKYAKPTSKAGKLITDDDDPMAIITRGLITNGVFPRRLVNAESYSLSRNAYQFTLLSTLYDANKSLLSVLPIPYVGKLDDMGQREREQKQKEIEVEWKRLISGIDDWKNALSKPDESGDKNRIRLREKSILGKPIGQLSVVRGYAYACGEGEDKDTLVRKLNSIDWRISNERYWRGVLIKPNGKMMYGSRVANNAARLIAHLVGIKLSRATINNLLDYIHGTTRPPSKKLPKPV